MMMTSSVQYCTKQSHLSPSGPGQWSGHISDEIGREVESTEIGVSLTSTTSDSMRIEFVVMGVSE